MRVLGVDAWVKGWVAVELIDGRFASGYTVTRLAELSALADFDAVAVDIPMGLLSSGFRAAEPAARQVLGKRTSSVFTTPPLHVLREESHAAANALCKRLTGMGLSAQSYALRERILEADELYGSPGLNLLEVHPEVSFAMMGEGPLAASKKTWQGLHERMTRLGAVGISVPGDIGEAAMAGADDVLDAAAGAWSANRYALGRAASLPNPPQINERGQHSAIWY